MIKTGSPKRFQDYCLELGARIRSCTVQGIYVLDGKTPEAMMKGETADISQISEYGQYEWVMFSNTSAQFPDNKILLGKYLGPSIGVFPAMTAKVMISNDHVVPRLTLAKRESP